VTVNRMAAGADPGPARDRVLDESAQLLPSGLPGTAPQEAQRMLIGRAVTGLDVR